ncbi:MAG: carbon-nitrogen hydrolase family protein [Kofleriaceae bacterium]
MLRIALANLPYPASPEDSVARTIAAIESADADLVAFPECYVPGYRGSGHTPPPPDQAWLDRAFEQIAAAAGKAGVAVVLGTERVVEGKLRATALVVDEHGQILGFQDKVQIDPSEEGTYTPGSERRTFHAHGVTFGVAICHEGWRYPETVRHAAMRGATLVLHPHFHEAEGGFRPTEFADARNTFHEKAVLCRAAENTIWVATINYASEGSPTTSAIADPDGVLLSFQPYGREGLLRADLDMTRATRLLASRTKRD